MTPRAFFLVSGLIFSLVVLLHLLRIMLTWEVVIVPPRFGAAGAKSKPGGHRWPDLAPTGAKSIGGGWAVPQAFSVVALPLAGFLAYQVFRLRK